MRINVYKEELTDRVKVVSKTAEKIKYYGVRFYLELPATVDGKQHKSPFMHQPGDDDSSAVTFWGSRDRLHELMATAVQALDSGEVDEL